MVPPDRIPVPARAPRPTRSTFGLPKERSGAPFRHFCSCDRPRLSAAGRRPAAEEGDRVVLGRPIPRRRAADDAAAALRHRPGWTDLRDAGLGEIPSNDFSLYDHVLDTAWMLGAIPERHRDAVPDIDLAGAAVSTGTSRWRAARATVAPLEMTKWFDTNYHYLVPEIGPDTAFALDAEQAAGRVRRGARRRRPHPPGDPRARHVPAAVQAGCRCAAGLLAADPARRPAAAVRRAAAPAAARPARSGCSSTSRRWCSTSRRRCSTPSRRAYRC